MVLLFLFSPCFSKSNISAFVPSANFLYPPENIRKPYGFLMFSGGREKVHWKQMG